MTVNEPGSQNSVHAYRGGVFCAFVPSCELPCLTCGEFLAAENLARLLHTHLELIVRVHNLVAAQHLAEILSNSLERFRLAEGQHVILIGQPARMQRRHSDAFCGCKEGHSLRLGRRKLVDLEFDPFTGQIITWRDARQIEANSDRNNQGEHPLKQAV